MVQRISFWVVALVFGVCSVARAEQFVLVDVSYTHSADTTKDSHYYVTLPANTPKDWTKPIDWSTGSVHLVVEAKTKPAGDAKTKLQVCFEGTPAYACTLQSPTYTMPGRVEWDSPFKDFWYGGDVDWSQGIKKVPLILKDDNNGKPAGDPKYMPTDLHVQVTLVSPGAKFVAPAAGSGGAGGAAAGAGATAGTGAAGMVAAGRGGAGGVSSQAGAGGAGTAAGAGAASGGGGSSAAVGGSPGGVSSTAGRSATGGSSAASAGNSGGAGAASPAATTAGTVGMMASPQVAERSSESEGGCQSTGRGASGAWAFAFVLLSWSALRRLGLKQRQRLGRLPSVR